MVAYFTASIVGKKDYAPFYQQIIDILKYHEIDVISDHIINTSEKEIRLESKEDRINFQKKLSGWITSASFVIAETSYPSISVGYEISLALQMHKPVLILYTTPHPPSLLAHYKDDNLICESYNSDTLKSIIEDFLNFTAGAADSRFTFFITSAIAAYLDEIARKKKIPKSVYLRQLIEKDMQKSSE